MAISKKNVTEFNEDVKTNGGYLYTTNPTLSSVLANRRISEAINKHLTSCKTLVDIGCGDGVYTAEIKKALPSLDIEGFDPASDAIAIAEENYPDITFKVINILQDNIEEVTRKFDVGILRGVLHHLPDQQLAIKNALKIAETVVIMEPNGNNPILKVIEKVSEYHRTHEEQSFMYWRLKRWCEKAGGVVVSKEYVGFIPFFFPTFPSRIIYFFQPFLEKVPFVREFLSGQIIMVCKRKSD